MHLRLGLAKGSITSAKGSLLFCKRILLVPSLAKCTLIRHFCSFGHFPGLFGKTALFVNEVRVLQGVQGDSSAGSTVKLG